MGFVYGVLLILGALWIVWNLQYFEKTAKNYKKNRDVPENSTTSLCS